MSEMTTQQLLDVVHKQQKRFQDLDSANGNLLDFKQECLFARQQILKNDYTMKIASQAPNSLQSAILNVAAIGISLNPASQHAYLVPRDNEICLDISYRGLTKLATDSGAIKWAKVELVYDNDSFEWCGPASAPEHKADPFSERGDLKGGYCIAKLPDGEVLTEVMPVEEINKVRDTSKAYQNGKGPWKTWYEEMAKKTILKRAYKSWPQTPNRRRLDEAVNVLHETEGQAYTIDEHGEFMQLFRNEDAFGLYMLHLRLGDDKWIALFNSFEKGEKTANKEKMRELEQKGVSQFHDYIAVINEAADNEDEQSITETVEGMPQKAVGMLMKQCNPQAQQLIEDAGLIEAA